MEILPGTIGRYEIRRELGRGRMGIVYEANDPILGRKVALKTIHVTFATGAEDPGSFEQRFFTEARAAARLAHPGIVVVHDSGRDPATGALYIALEYLVGQTLADLMRGGAPLGWPEALRITASIARALHHAHARRVIHRDVKPENIMLLASGEPKIMDFGIAKVEASQITAAGHFFGTPRYMSPEQARGDKVDARSDLFALGAVAYLLLTGRTAFAGSTLPAIVTQVMHTDPTPPSEIVAGLPPEVDRITARALAKLPEARYPDGAAMAQHIEDVLAGPWARQAKGEAATGPGRAALLGGILIAVAAGSVALAVGILVLAWSGAQKPTAKPPTGLAPSAPAETAGEVVARSTESPGPVANTEPSVGPARLVIAFDHSLESGILKIWIDDTLVVNEKLKGRESKKLLVFKGWTGSVNKILEVSPGRHDVRVEVAWENNKQVESTSAKFNSRATLRLEAKVGGLRNNLSLDWR